MDNRKHIKWSEPTKMEILAQNDFMRIILSVLFNQITLDKQGTYKVVDFTIKHHEELGLYQIWIKGKNLFTEQTKVITATLDERSYILFARKEHPWQEK